MRVGIRIISYVFVLAVLTLSSMLFFAACGVPVVMNDTGETVVLNPETNCVATNDCDGDGLYASCDTDDGDAFVVLIKEGCDGDGDGFVDVACTDYSDANGDKVITAEERNINCDVCPGLYDPEQLDLNEDGIGDACGGILSVNESVAPPEDADDDGIADDVEVDGDASETADGFAVTITDAPASVRQKGTLTLDFAFANNSDQTAFLVAVVFNKSLILADASASTFAPKISGLVVSPFMNLGTTLEEQELTSSANATADYTASFSIPEDLAEGTYSVKLVIKYLDENSVTQTAAFDYTDARIEVKEALVIGPMVQGVDSFDPLGAI